MLEDLFYDLLVLYHADYFHFSGTFRASQGVHFVDFLNNEEFEVPGYIFRI